MKRGALSPHFAFAQLYFSACFGADFFCQRCALCAALLRFLAWSASGEGQARLTVPALVYETLSRALTALLVSKPI